MAGIKGEVVVMVCGGLVFGEAGWERVELFLCVPCFVLGLGWRAQHPTKNQTQSRMGHGTIGESFQSLPHPHPKATQLPTTNQKQSRLGQGTIGVSF